MQRSIAGEIQRFKPVIMYSCFILIAWYSIVAFIFFCIQWAGEAKFDIVEDWMFNPKTWLGSITCFFLPSSTCSVSNEV